MTGYTLRRRGLIAARADATALAAIADINKAFAEFKTAHAANAAASDAVYKEQMEKLNVYMSEKQAEIDKINQQLAAVASNALSGNKPLRDPEYTEAFSSYFKKGSEVHASLNKGADAEGGYLTPIEWDRTITAKLKLVSPMRQVCRVQSIGGTTFSKLFSNSDAASGWVGETTARPETAAPTTGTLQFPTGELYANPSATQQFLDDAQIDAEAWLGDEVQTEFNKQEGTAFVSGNGTNKPHGFLTYVAGAANAARHPFGAILLTNSGHATQVTSAGLVNLVYALPAAFAGNAVWLMNRNTINKIRLLVDGQGNFIWQPSLVAGQPSTLLGYPVIETPDMPDVAAGAKAIAFGDFNQGYLIVDRTVVRVLRDPYTNKPYVMFYTTKRVGGGVLNPEAIKVQNISV